MEELAGKVCLVESTPSTVPHMYSCRKGKVTAADFFVFLFTYLGKASYAGKQQRDHVEDPGLAEKSAPESRMGRRV